MEYNRHGRSLIPVGGIFEEPQSALQFVNNFEKDIISEPLQTLQFEVEENGYLTIYLSENLYFITYTALKDLCKLLKLPASFINKFPPSRLMLDNLNRNPYLKEDSQPVKFIIWKWEDQEVIAGILPAGIGHIPTAEFLQLMENANVFHRDNTRLDSLVITGEEIVQYFLLPEEITRDSYSFSGGFALHYSPTRLSDTSIYPFYRMAVTTQQGELFDFDFEATKKLHIVKRRKPDFVEKTIELATEYVGENLGFDIDNNLKRGVVAREIFSVKLALLKHLKSKSTFIYNYHGIKVEPGAVVEEIIPEYKYFLQTNREELKNLEKFEANTKRVDFYLPLFYNRIFTFPASSENGYFFIRYRQAIGKIFDKILEEAGDVLLAPGD